MDARFSRSSIPRRGDPHSWNTWENYRTIHEIRLEQHPFIDWSREQTLSFGDPGKVIRQSGNIYCLNDVVILVRKILETDHTSQGLLRVRGHRRLLRYHNIHLHDEDYHHRVFNWRTGEEVLYERLERYQFPTLAEVLDEARAVYFAYK